MANIHLESPTRFTSCTRKTGQNGSDDLNDVISLWVWQRKEKYAKAVHLSIMEDEADMVHISTNILCHDSQMYDKVDTKLDVFFKLQIKIMMHQ